VDAVRLAQETGKRLIARRGRVVGRYAVTRRDDAHTLSNIVSCDLIDLIGAVARADAPRPSRHDMVAVRIAPDAIAIHRRTRSGTIVKSEL
jgi:hypothetical protein